MAPATEDQRPLARCMAARYGKVFTQQEPVARVATSDQRDDRNSIFSQVWISLRASMISQKPDKATIHSSRRVCWSCFLIYNRLCIFQYSRSMLDVLSSQLTERWRPGTRQDIFVVDARIHGLDNECAGPDYCCWAMQGYADPGKTARQGCHSCISKLSTTSPCTSL